MKQIKKILYRGVSPLLMLGLAGCYYPVPVYTNGYAPANQASSAPHPGQECREYEQPGMIMGKRQTLVSTACRQSDGSWRDAVDGAPVAEPPAPNMPPPSNEPTPTMPQTNVPPPTTAPLADH